MTNEHATSGAPARDALDDKANRLFSGKVVRKDLVRKVKVGTNVPVFVLEYLLGKYCASSDEVAIQMGLQVVNDTLANNYIRPDEGQKAQSRVKENGKHSFIDKVKVRLVDSDYWAEAVNFGNKFIHIPTHYVQGVRAAPDGGHLGAGRHALRVRRGGEGARTRSGSSGSRRSRSPRSTSTITGASGASSRPDEWIDLMLRSMGYEPAGDDAPAEAALPPAARPALRAELQPGGAGTARDREELRRPGDLALRGAPDRLAHRRDPLRLRDRPAEGARPALGRRRLRRGGRAEEHAEGAGPHAPDLLRVGSVPAGVGGERAARPASPCSGTRTGPWTSSSSRATYSSRSPRTSERMAFLDRLHTYVPGWEIPKMRPDLFSSHYGFVVDYLAEALREMRKLNFTEVVERDFAFGSHLVQRDRKAVQKTFSGLMKLIHPHGEATTEEMVELVELALEGRRRVKEQLKKLGSFEFHQTSFSYIDRETGEEKFVGVPEQGGRNLIPPDPPGPGTVYTAGVSDQSVVGLYRVEVSYRPAPASSRWPAASRAR